MAQTESYQKGYAFNLALIAVAAPKKDEHVLMRVGKWGSSVTKNLGPRRVDELDPTELELDTSLNPQDFELALWVGIRPDSAPYLRTENPIAPTDATLAAKVKGVKVPKQTSVDTLGRLGNLPIWSESNGYTKVVVKFAHQDKVIFHELRNRDAKTGLCLAQPIHIDDCFFFQPYRDDTLKAVGGRRSEWPKVIKSYVANQINKDLSATGFRAARSTARVEFQPQTARLLNIEGLTNEFAVSGATWVLDDLEQAIQKIDEELAREKIPDLIALHSLLDITKKFPDDQGQKVLEVMAEMFPSLAKVKCFNVMTVNQFAVWIRCTETRVTYGSLRSLFGLFAMYCDSNNFRANTDIKRVAPRIENYIHKYMDYVCEAEQPRPPKYTDVSTDLKLWLRHHVMLMENIVTNHKENVEAMINWHGTAICGDSLWQLWENVAESPDMDAAKQFALQGARFLAKRMVATTDITTRNLDAYVEILKKSLKDIDDEETTSVAETQEVEADDQDMEFFG
ncbi:hypothetical protein N0V83_007594 [Neocucurbitaria cava]|uniref:Uncharacterized protein n=1 Tax=Neocucurbitaria cava TaxID=798079 RepID=A0A9W8Y667_9PLEO|nr:hypothetical protein N0V83_007594 [Neocucurbitaria cava]